MRPYSLFASQHLTVVKAVPAIGLHLYGVPWKADTQEVNFRPSAFGPQTAFRVFYPFDSVVVDAAVFSTFPDS